MVVGGHESENLRETPQQQAVQVNPEVFRDRPPLPAQATDQVQVGDAKIGATPEANLEYARLSATQTANQFLLRTTQLTPGEFKVMGGVLDLGIKTNAWSPENIQQIKDCLVNRATQQNNPNAAQGLRNMADKITHA
jgi:hypothetical protein